MNCELWQHKLLLAESGELTADERRDMEAHLAGCQVCRDFRDASVTLACAVRPVLRHGEPAATTIAAIGREASSRSSRSRLRVFGPLFVQVAACAAALTLVVGGWVFLRSDPDPGSDSIHQVGSLLSMVSEKHAAGSGVPAPAASDDETRLRALARELLRMEGLSADEVL